MRGLLPEHFFFLVCRVHDWPCVAALEQLEIKSRLPNANVQKRTPSGTAVVRRQRARPPKSMRTGQRSKVGPFDAFDVACVRKVLPHSPSDRLGVVLGHVESTSFCSLYALCQKRRYLFHSQVGSLDIYAPASRQLLIMWWKENGILVVPRLLFRALSLWLLVKDEKDLQLGGSMPFCVQRVFQL